MCITIPITTRCRGAHIFRFMAPRNLMCTETCDMITAQLESVMFNLVLTSPDLFVSHCRHVD